MNAFPLSKHIKIDREVIPSILMIGASLLALILVNSPLQDSYTSFFHHTFLFKDFTWHMFVNDFLMAIFFFGAMLEIKKEILEGSLSSFKKASFPIVAALGGVIVPAIIYIIINKHTPYLIGIGVPISTDIAFAVGMFMLFRKKLNPKLKIFLLSLAVVDDLISIAVIGILYTSNLNMPSLVIATIVTMVLIGFNRVLKIKKIIPYLVGGIILWYFTYQSGIHATMSGVVLGIIIPHTRDKRKHSMLETLEHALSPFINKVILPVFAFANMGVSLLVTGSIKDSDYLVGGIVLALVFGKPLGILVFTIIADKLGIAEKPNDVGWLCILNTSIFAGIGFTMSIFVSEIAFEANNQVINVAKIAIILSGMLTILIVYITTNYLYHTNHKLGNYACNHKKKECQLGQPLK